MSYWRYQIMRHIADNGEPFLGIHEFFIMHDKSEGWTAKPVPIETETLPEMRQALIQILQDAERHGIRDAKTGEKIDG